MLLKKNLNLLRRLYIIKSNNQAFSSIRDSADNYGLDFPIKLDGIKDKFISDSEKSEIIAKVFKEFDLKNGFELAYLNTFEALENHDLEYFEGICEERLYEAIKESLQRIQEHNYSIECFQARRSKIYSKCQNLTLIHGLHIERNKNGKENEYIQSVKSLKNLTIRRYIPTNISRLKLSSTLPPFAQIVMLYQSPMTINIYDNNDIKINQRKDSKVHKFIFENKRIVYDQNELRDDFISNLKYIFDPFKMIQDKYIGKDYEWKLVDIDDYLKGNPHVD